MSEQAAEQVLSRTESSTAVEDIGWRYLLGALGTTVAVSSLQQALDVAGEAVTACGPDADTHLEAVPRPDRVELSLQTTSVANVTRRDVELARAVTDAVRAIGLDTRSRGSSRPVQSLEIAIDAIDIPAVRPFWRAVLGYTDEPGYDGPEDAIVDPLGVMPAVWFQQMDRPRPQRNRIHFDITVAHDEAEDRVVAALAAGGTLVSDARARAFWVLADAQGNEICVCTRQDRD
jgi:4a-hydroxytetrahydrobiopterin dehydratase